MKAFRPVTLGKGDLVSPLAFLDREAAERFSEVLLWPSKPLGFFTLPSGEKVPLDRFRTRVESFELEALHEAELGLLVKLKEGEFGYASVVPGRAFDPAEFRRFTDQEQRDPIVAPKIAHARRELEKALKHSTSQEEPKP